MRHGHTSYALRARPPPFLYVYAGGRSSRNRPKQPNRTSVFIILKKCVVLVDIVRNQLSSKGTYAFGHALRLLLRVRCYKVPVAIDLPGGPATRLTRFLAEPLMRPFSKACPPLLCCLNNVAVFDSHRVCFNGQCAAQEFTILLNWHQLNSTERKAASAT